MINLEKFKKFTLEINGVEKDVFPDSYEKGEGERCGQYFCAHLNAVLDIDSTKVSKDYLTELVVSHLKRILDNNQIKGDWIAVSSSSAILSTSELDITTYGDGTPLTTTIQEEEAKGNQVYACYYFLSLSINGIKLNEEDLLELFNFTS